MENNNNHINQFEKIFKETLNNSQMTPPPGVWEGISAGMGSAAAATTATAVTKIGIIGKIAIGVAMAGGSYLGYKAIESQLQKNEAPFEVINEETIESNIEQKKTTNTTIDYDQVDQIKEDLSIEIENNISFSNTPQNKNTIEVVSQQQVSEKSNYDSKDSNQPLLDFKNNKPINKISNNFSLTLLKEAKCIGDTLHISSTNLETKWYINNEYISKGEDLKYKTHQAGEINIIAKIGEQKLSYQASIRNIPSFQIRIQQIENKSHFVELSPKKSGDVQWTINNKKYYGSEVLVDLLANTPYTLKADIVNHYCGNFDIEKKYRWNQNKNSKPLNNDIVIPNVFTPNNDGVNDFYKVDIPKVQLFKMTIFDKQGNNILFETTDNNIGWDGINTFTGLEYEAGEYLVQLVYQQEDGEIIEKKYIITLIRK